MNNEHVYVGYYIELTPKQYIEEMSCYGCSSCDIMKNKTDTFCVECGNKLGNFIRNKEKTYSLLNFVYDHNILEDKFCSAIDNSNGHEIIIPNLIGFGWCGDYDNATFEITDEIKKEEELKFHEKYDEYLAILEKEFVINIKYGIVQYYM